MEQPDMFHIKVVSEPEIQRVFVPYSGPLTDQQKIQDAI